MALTAYSYSRLTTYDKCSQLYRLLYELEVREARTDTFHTRLGSYCHASLEAFYECEDGSVESPYHALTKENGVWDTELRKLGLDPVRADLQRYAGHTTKLYYRASAGYKGADAIRNAKDGGVPLAPEFTTAWKEYSRQYGLDGLAARIDRMAGELSPNWTGISLSDVYAQSLAMMYQYKNPKEIVSIVAIELALSEVLFQAADENNNPLPGIACSKARATHPLYRDSNGELKLIGVNHEVFMPKISRDGVIVRDGADIVWNNTSLFHGYIDLLARDEEGRLLIIDHKTSKELPTEAKVSRHEQLLAYGFAIYHLTGEMPYKIGINHLRSNKLVMAKFDLAKAEIAVSRLASIQKGIEAGVFIKRDPEGFDTPCVRRPMRADKEYILCPGLRHCHPEVWKSFQTFTNDEDIF